MNGAGAQKAGCARLCRKTAAIFTSQVFYVKLLSLRKAHFFQSVTVIHAWNPNTLEVGVGGSRVLCQLGLFKPPGLPGTYSCIYWGHTVLVLLFEHAISHTSSQVEDLFLCDGPLGGDWPLRAVFMNGFMCWCVIISGPCWEMVEDPEVDVKMHSSGWALFSPAVVLFNFLLGMKWETPPYVPTALTFCCNIGQKCGTKWPLVNPLKNHGPKYMSYLLRLLPSNILATSIPK